MGGSDVQTTQPDGSVARLLRPLAREWPFSLLTVPVLPLYRDAVPKQQTVHTHLTRRRILAHRTGRNEAPGSAGPGMLKFGPLARIIHDSSWRKHAVASRD